MKAAWLIAVTMLALACASLPAASTTSPTTQPHRDWFAVPADGLAKTSEANGPLPWDQPVDERLLTALVLNETNRYRAQEKLPALRHLDRVDSVALMHANDQAHGGWVGHVNEKDPQKRTLMDRMRLLGMNPMFGGENILIEYGFPYLPGRKVYVVPGGMSYEPHGEPIRAYTYRGFAEQIVKRWWESPHHKENIVSPHARFMGFGMAQGESEDERRFHKLYCVQVFYAPMPGSGRER